MTATPVVLELEHVGVEIDGRTILEDLSLLVQPGEFVGCIGPNGSGKSTLLQVILGLMPPARGIVRVVGERVHRGNRLIGYVPQNIRWDPDLPLRGRDVVGFGWDGHRWGVPLPSRTRRERIDQALAAVDALGYADRPVGRLSGGEQQRLVIAQALLTNPKILLLDEPLSNLDIGSAHEVVEHVARIGKERNIAVILVAHDINPLLRHLDNVLYLAHGRAAVGPVADVIQNDVLTRLYGYEVEVLRVKGRILVVGGGASGEVVDVSEGMHA